MKKTLFFFSCLFPLYLLAQNYSVTQADAFYTSKEYEKAYKAYIQNHNQLSGLQKFQLAICALTKDAPQLNFTEGTKWMINAANAGYNEAYIGLYELLAMKENPSRDTVQAVNYLRKAAEKDTKAMILLGRLYGTGTLVKLNDEEAVKWFKKAVDNNNYKGYYYLGLLEREGKKDAAAFSYWKAGALKGDKDCMFEYAFALMEGTSTPKELQKAAYWFQRTIDASTQEYGEKDYKLARSAKTALAMITGKPLKSNDAGINSALRDMAAQGSSGFSKYKGQSISTPSNESYNIFSNDEYFEGVNNPLYLSYVKISVGKGIKVDKYQFTSATEISVEGYIVQNLKMQDAITCYREWAENLKRLFSDFSQTKYDDKSLVLTGTRNGTKLSIEVFLSGKVDSDDISVRLEMKTITN